MNTVLLPCDSPRGIILLFLGWGTGLKPFLHLRKPGYDILLINDYRDFSPESLESRLRAIRDDRFRETGEEYAETIVIAWSFGVRAADDFLRSTRRNVTLRLAVNGTLSHIDAKRGIPPEIFNGTLENLSSPTLKKFRLRCVGNMAAYKKLFPEVESENIDSLKEELRWFASLDLVADTSLWDKAIIGLDDHIFPPDNQMLAWEGTDIYPFGAAAHYPDFGKIITEFVADKRRVADKFGCTRRNYTRNADAQKQTAQTLFEYLWQTAGKRLTENRRALTVLEAGHGDGTFTRRYFPELSRFIKKLVLADISQDAYQPSAGGCDEEESGIGLQTVVGDVESGEFSSRWLTEETYDMILSASMLQWLNSPSAFLGKCCRALRPGGVIAIAYYGEGTLTELIAAGGSGLKYPSMRRMTDIARKAGLDVEIAESEDIVLEFDSAMDALRHLKLTGVNALPKDSSPADTRRIIRDWPLDTQGKATLTFRPVYLIIKKNRKELTKS